jgi:hypothetical protein
MHEFLREFIVNIITMGKHTALRQAALCVHHEHLYFLRVEVFSDVIQCHWLNGAQHFEGTTFPNITHCLETSQTIQPAAQYHIPLDRNPQLHPVTNLKTCIYIFIIHININQYYNASSENKKYDIPQLTERGAFQK